jgi:hypothetical protein
VTTVSIAISDRDAAALTRKAAAEGLTLEAWFQNMAEREAALPLTDDGGSIVERMRKLRASVKPDPEGWTTRDYVNYGRR